MVDDGWIVPEAAAVSGLGTRGARAPDLRLTCAAGPYDVDLLVHERPDPGRVEMTGQVLRLDGGHDPVCGLRLDVVEAGAPGVVTAAETDRFGEFDLRLPCEGRFGLRLGRAPEAPCVLIRS